MATVARLPTRLLPHGLAPDPGLEHLRVAARAALILPLVLALGLLVLRNAQMTLYMAFAVFSLLVLANYGGPRLSRLVAYVVTTLAGCALVAAGTIASPYPGIAALAALVVVFGIWFAGVFSGYVAASRFPLLLAYVLAASVPAPANAVPEQVLGWLIGGGIATAARVLLWPHDERDALRTAASDAIHALAALVASGRYDPAATERRQSAASAVAEFRKIYRQTPYRPAGPTRRDRALARMVTELELALSFAVAPAGDVAASSRRLPEGNLLAAAVVSVLEASAAVLKGGRVPDLRSLEQARLAHRTALDAWAGAQLRSGASAESVLAGLDQEHWLRMLAYHCLSIGAIATIVAGRDFEPGSVRVPYETSIEAGFRPMLRRIGQTLAAHISWTSPLLHSSVRAAIGLALGVLLARELGLQHAFWVVLGTMSVLRSNALGTGRTTVQAVAGTLLGFVVGGLVTLLFARSSVVLWAALPVAVFLAAYTPSALSFVAGQGSFTILLLILFNVLTPVGWEVGLVRIEDVVLGAAIGVAVATLLWPRGARSDYASNLSRLYRLVAVHIAEAINLALGQGRAETVNTTRAQVSQAREKTGESFDQLLAERSSSQLAPELAGFVLAAADHALTVADTLQVAFDMGYVARGCASGVERLDSGGTALVASWFILAERMEGVGAVRTVPLDRKLLRQAALDCLESWKGECSQRSAAIAVAWARERIEELSDLVRDLEEPAGRVAASAAAPWWR